MAGEKTMRLSQVARKLNVGTNTISDFLSKKGINIENKPSTKITSDQYNMLAKEFKGSLLEKEEASELTIGQKHAKNVVIKSETSTSPKEEEKPKEEPKKEKKKEAVMPKADKMKGLTVLGKIDLDNKKEDNKQSTNSEKQSRKPAPKQEKSQKVAKTAETTSKQQKDQKKATQNEKDSSSKSKEEKKNEKVSKNQEPKTSNSPAEQKTDKSSQTLAKEENIAEAKEENVIEAKADQLRGLKVLGKIQLPTTSQKKKSATPVASSDKANANKKKRKRKRIKQDGSDNNQGGGNRNQNQGQGGNRNQNQGQGGNRNQNQGQGGNRNQNQGQGGNRNQGGGNRNQGGGNRNQNRGRGQNRGNNKKTPEKEAVSAKEIQDKIKATIAKLGGKKQGQNRAKHRKDKRSTQAKQREEQLLQQEQEAKVLKVTEFISANELASLMDVSVNDIISACMMLGMFVSINQRLDTDMITMIAEEFGFEVDFTTSDEEDISSIIEDDNEEDMRERAPIVTIMGHVDHGKTSLLDFIRNSKVTEGEAGGITQHIGAYNVKTNDGRPITFLDTPGHEAFTAMRARGAKLTDIVILVVAADDTVMPQTKEAINHARSAGVPIIIALNKIDKPTANADKIREELSNEDILVEEWGGKYQCQEISAKTGVGIDDLLEKILIESELLELKANPSRAAIGTVVEASLDKGRGYLSTVLVQTGTLKIGDIVVAGAHYGRVKAMTDHRGKRLKEAGPATPVQLLGLDGAPQAGDRFVLVESDREARETTNKRKQILREQAVRTKKHLTIEELTRRIKIGDFKELNLIIKGDVDGSVEALTDSLLKLSTDEVQVNVVHKGVGLITESDIHLACASDAIVIGFQVRPSLGAKRLAEQEEIEIRLYSIIYKAIDEMKEALEGMLAPEFEEVIVGNVEIRETFKISKVGTIAGCYVKDGYIKRSSNIRIIREGIVKYTGEIGALKRFKDDVSEVKFGYECGLSIKNFNDLEVDDIIEVYEEREVKRKLK